MIQFQLIVSFLLFFLTISQDEIDEKIMKINKQLESFKNCKKCSTQELNNFKGKKIGELTINSAKLKTLNNLQLYKISGEGSFENNLIILREDTTIVYVKIFNNPNFQRIWYLENDEIISHKWAPHDRKILIGKFSIPDLKEIFKSY